MSRLQALPPDGDDPLERACTEREQEQKALHIPQVVRMLLLDPRPIEERDRALLESLHRFRRSRSRHARRAVAGGLTSPPSARVLFQPRLTADLSDSFIQLGETSSLDGTISLAAAQAGIEVPDAYWQTVEKAWIDHQESDGGWNYTKGNKDHPTSPPAEMDEILAASGACRRSLSCRAAPNRSGRWFTTAPTSSPPADPPRAAIRSGGLIEVGKAFASMRRLAPMGVAQ